jgi:hypothetical protein
MIHLWAVFLGGKNARARLGEDHEVVFVAARDAAEAKTKGKAKWSGEIKKGVHVDSLAQIDRVDGYTIRVDPEGESDPLLCSTGPTPEENVPPQNSTTERL